MASWRRGRSLCVYAGWPTRFGQWVEGVRQLATGIRWRCRVVMVMTIYVYPWAHMWKYCQWAESFGQLATGVWVVGGGGRWPGGDGGVGGRRRRAMASWRRGCGW